MSCNTLGLFSEHQPWAMMSLLWNSRGENSLTHWLPLLGMYLNCLAQYKSQGALPMVYNTVAFWVRTQTLNQTKCQIWEELYPLPTHPPNLQTLNPSISKGLYLLNTPTWVKISKQKASPSKESTCAIKQSLWSPSETCFLMYDRQQWTEVFVHPWGLPRSFLLLGSQRLY